MAVSHEQARLVADRLESMARLGDLADRLKPQSPADRPLPPDLPGARDWSLTGQQQRLAFLKEQCAVELPHLAGIGDSLSPDALKGSIEHYIGMAQVPVGVIGPLRINGVHAHGDYFIPLATTEGALVASYHRGARVVSLAGGVAAVTITEKVQRAPVFSFTSIAESGLFAAWAAGEFASFANAAATRTTHGRLTGLQVHVEANHVYLICEFHTGDAAGQNMVTLCTAAICDDIVARSPVRPQSWFIEANMSGDKKATSIAFQSTRGRKVIAESTLPRELVERVLHTTPDKMCEYWRVSVVGAMQSGAIGANGHYSNGLAALFIACGQDVACVSEASVGITRLDMAGDDLHVGVTLPGLVVGTVGGGTRLPTASECLRLLRCEGNGGAAAFAEICAATVLAGEISIVAALCSGDFARAHERLGRTGPRSSR